MYKSTSNWCISFFVIISLLLLVGCLAGVAMTPLHSAKSALSNRSGMTSVGPAQYMREEMLTPSPPPNWGHGFVAQLESRGGGEMEFKDEVSFLCFFFTCIYERRRRYLAQSYYQTVCPML